MVFGWMFIPHPRKNIPETLRNLIHSHHFFSNRPVAENAKRQDHRMHQSSQLEPKADAGAIQTMGPDDVETQHRQNDVVHRHLMVGGQGNG